MYSDASEHVLVNPSFVKTSCSCLVHCRPPCFDPYSDLLSRQTVLFWSPCVNPSGCSMYTGTSISPLRYACDMSNDCRCQSSMAANANTVLTVGIRMVGANTSRYSKPSC